MSGVTRSNPLWRTGSGGPQPLWEKVEEQLGARVLGEGSHLEVRGERALHQHVTCTERLDLGIGQVEREVVNGSRDVLAGETGRVLVVDFKTNRPAPRTEADVPQVYLAQMALYRAAAGRIFTGKRIVCGLVFTDGPRLLQLSDGVLDAQMAGMAARLAQPS